MSAPIVDGVDALCITMVRGTEKPCQALLFDWNSDQVDMIRHKTICQNFNTRSYLQVPYEFNVGHVVGFIEKSPLSSNSTLCDVMWETRYYKAREFRHRNILDL